MLFGMEVASQEVMPKESARQKEDTLHQFMILRLITFCLVFLKLGHLLGECIRMDNGLGLMDLHGTLSFGEMVTPQTPQ